MAREPRDNRRPKLNARWYGELPKVGDFLMSKLRPRAAYKIVGIRERGAISTEPLVPTSLEFTTEIVELGAVPEGATVHDWKWDTRRKEGSSWR